MCCSVTTARPPYSAAGVIATTSSGWRARTGKSARTSGRRNWPASKSRPAWPRRLSTAPASPWARASISSNWTASAPPTFSSLRAATKSPPTPWCRLPGCCCCSVAPARTRCASAPRCPGVRHNWLASSNRSACSSTPCRSSPAPVPSNRWRNGCNRCRRRTCRCASRSTRRCSTSSAGPGRAVKRCSTTSWCSRTTRLPRPCNRVTRKRCALARWPISSRPTTR
ncbi:hypothetical protein D3C73_794370 [compost metagenome]